MSSSPYDPRSIKVYTALASSVINGKCPEVSKEALGSLFANMLLVPQNADPQSLQYSQIKYFVGLVDVHSGEPSKAAKAFSESLRARPGASHAMTMAAHLATGGYFEEALYFSDLALSQLDVEPKGMLRGARVYEADIREFQAIVRSDMDAQPDVDTFRPES
jgi:hypothetical protein